LSKYTCLNREGSVGKRCFCTKRARQRLANEDALIGCQYRFIVCFQCSIPIEILAYQDRRLGEFERFAVGSVTVP